MRALILSVVTLSIFGCSGPDAASATPSSTDQKQAEEGRQKVLNANVNPDQKAEIERMQAGSGK